MLSVRVKICGLTRTEDAALALELGAWALGVIFAPESPRRLDLQRAAEVLAPAADAEPDAAVSVGARSAGRDARTTGAVERVGVFVNAESSEIVEAVAACGLTAVQLHGEESPVRCLEIRKRAGVPVIKVLRVAGPAALERVVQFDTEYILLDTYDPERRGGTGEVFDWSLAAALPEVVRSGRVILSGGLNPDNILEAARAVSPFALDVSSGVESAPGVKDSEKLRRLFETIRMIKEAS
ncbi:MAG: phosphoribosylanthranilate isomerase [Thermoleophilia bacterium]